MYSSLHHSLSRMTLMVSPNIDNGPGLGSSVAHDTLPVNTTPSRKLLILGRFRIRL
jgi:hypothetical protein